MLLHGWPETKRIWWRNIEPLAAAGFEVIVPDLRGFGDSGLAPDGFYDPATHARDVHALVNDVLGHDRCATAGGDVGGVVAQDLALRFDGFVERQCLFNTVPPILPDDYAAAGIPPRGPARRAHGRRLLHPPGPGGRRARSRARHAREAAPLHRAVLRLAVLGGAGHLPPRGRRLHDRAVRGRGQAARRLRHLRDGARHPAGCRAAAAVRDAARCRRCSCTGPRTTSSRATSPRAARSLSPSASGPFVVQGAGHFLQWERADVLNQSLVYFFADLREVVGMSVELQDSTALVTGATGGIGQAIVRALHARGATRDRQRAQARGAGGRSRASSTGSSRWSRTSPIRLRWQRWSSDGGSTCWSRTPRCPRRGGSTASPRRRSTARSTSTCARRCSSRGRCCPAMMERGVRPPRVHLLAVGEVRERGRVGLQRDQVRPARLRLRAERGAARHGRRGDHGLPRLHPRGGHVRRQPA